MTYAILVMHRGSEREVEKCRVGTKATAESIKQKLAAETYIDRHAGDKRGRAVSRYLSVRAQEATAPAGPSQADPPFAAPPDGVRA